MIHRSTGVALLVGLALPAACRQPPAPAERREVRTQKVTFAELPWRLAVPTDGECQAFTPDVLAPPGSRGIHLRTSAGRSITVVFTAGGDVARYDDNHPGGNGTLGHSVWGALPTTPNQIRVGHASFSTYLAEAKTLDELLDAPALGPPRAIVAFIRDHCKLD